MRMDSNAKEIEILDVSYITKVFKETCTNRNNTFENYYFLDSKNIMRRSSQYHGSIIGQILVERFDR